MPGNSTRSNNRQSARAKVFELLAKYKHLAVKPIRKGFLPPILKIESNSNKALAGIEPGKPYVTYHLVGPQKSSQKTEHMTFEIPLKI